MSLHWCSHFLLLHEPFPELIMSLLQISPWACIKNRWQLPVCISTVAMQGHMVLLSECIECPCTDNDLGFVGEGYPVEVQ